MREHNAVETQLKRQRYILSAALTFDLARLSCVSHRTYYHTTATRVEASQPNVHIRLRNGCTRKATCCKIGGV